MTAPTRELENRVTLVTGGASGIGRALCEKLAADGAVVIVADINAPGAKEVAEAIRQRAGGAGNVAVGDGSIQNLSLGPGSGPSRDGRVS